MDTQTQTKAILAHMKSGKSITALDALHQFGCLRLSARIHDIRGIITDHIYSSFIVTPSGKRIKRYWLVEAAA